MIRTTLAPVDGRLELRETTKGRRPRTAPILVQQIAGHSSAVTTLDVYAQLFALMGSRRRGPLMPC